MEIRLLLFLPWLIQIANSFALYHKEWMDGYYQEGEYCKPCHSTCKTWSNSSSWDSCHSYMMLNSTTNICDSWPYAEYFDETAKVWRPWNGVWTGQWMHQTECFDWSVGEKFDLSSLKWTSEWNFQTKLIESNQFNIPSFWRDYNYYVDPLSNESVELGTLKYPYRSFKSVAIEIINFFSHSETNISIYIKDVYFKDDITKFINISSVTIKSHPDYTDFDRRAVLSPTEVPQTVLFGKTLFHLLNTTEIKANEMISKGDFSDKENALFNTGKIAILLARTSLNMEGIDVYREGSMRDASRHFIFAVYLQTKIVRLGKELLYILKYHFKYLYLCLIMVYTIICYPYG